MKTLREHIIEAMEKKGYDPSTDAKRFAREIDVVYQTLRRQLTESLDTYQPDVSIFGITLAVRISLHATVEGKRVFVFNTCRLVSFHITSRIS